MQLLCPFWLWSTLTNVQHLRISNIVHQMITPIMSLEVLNQLKPRDNLWRSIHWPHSSSMLNAKFTSDLHMKQPSCVLGTITITIIDIRYHVLSEYLDTLKRYGSNLHPSLRRQCLLEVGIVADKSTKSEGLRKYDSWFQLAFRTSEVWIYMTKSLQCEASYFINFHDSKRSMHYLYQNVIGMANVPLTSVTSNGCNVIYVDTNVFFFFLPSKIHNKFHDINIFVVYKWSSFGELFGQWANRLKGHLLLRKRRRPISISSLGPCKVRLT